MISRNVAMASLAARRVVKVMKAVPVPMRLTLRRSSEVCVRVKRGLFTWQKRPICMANEAYSHGKRGLFIWQTMPIYMAKEACWD